MGQLHPKVRVLVCQLVSFIRKTCASCRYHQGGFESSFHGGPSAGKRLFFEVDFDVQIGWCFNVFGLNWFGVVWLSLTCLFDLVGCFLSLLLLEQSGHFCIIVSPVSLVLFLKTMRS